ncbi:MAG TPA: hypothetical protein VE981_20435 [Planctomycetota bacterium]|nr:hypothetical protein [Planctomycetota bacterium]
MRVGLRIVAAALLLAMVAGILWACGIYYWHHRVERVIRYMEDGGDGAALSRDMENTLYAAGCRALPNLIRATKPDRSAAFLAFTTHQAVLILNQEPAQTKGDCDLRATRRADYEVQSDDPAPVREAKVARLSQYWTAHAGDVHQWWRFWTCNCRHQE